MTDRETLEVDLLIVGGGPAGLAAAIRARQLAPTLNVCLIEKAKQVGAHGISGAVMDPKALAELLPDFRARGCPIESDVTEDFVWFLTEADCLSLPVIPPPLRQHGNVVLSLARLTVWMGEQAEAAGVEIFAGFPGADLLLDGARVVGVRTADKGVDREGRPKPNFEPGVDVRAKVTILAEGPRGHLARILTRRFDLEARANPQTYATGVKEVWDFPEGHVHAGRVIHTMGFPLKPDTFGGGFIYGMTSSRLAVGFVVGLDYPDPFLDPHHELQRFKTHPAVASILSGGAMVEYGAKTIPEGGYFAIPKLAAPGAMLVGDSASLLDPMRLKGVHTAIKSGMLAAETAVEAIRAGDVGDSALARYEQRLRASWIERELYASRFFKHGFKYGMIAGLVNAGIGQLTGGWSPLGRRMEPGHRLMKRVADYHGAPDARPERIAFDDRLTFRKTTDVFHSGTIHEENAPCHLKVADPGICVDRCTREYGNPCQHFCPAAVYEWLAPGRLQINFANCVHCKTCDIMDPYGIIQWVPPEGGGGPAWKRL
jgi:electron-transferring-flavoprotein dehydrogenase